MTMSAMAAVHEQMHQRTGQDQQIRQDAEEVGPVLGQQKERRHRAQHQPTDAKTRSPQASGSVRLGRCSVFHIFTVYRSIIPASACSSEWQ